MKRKANFILLILFLGISHASFAQRLGGGLLIGPTCSTMQISGIDSTRFRIGFTGGVRIALIPENTVFGAEIDIIYTGQGMSTKSGYDDEKQKVTYGKKSSYINVPLLLNVYLRRWTDDDESEAKMLRLRLGPQIGFCLGGSDLKTIRGKNLTSKEIRNWEKGTYNWIDYGITAAVAYWSCELRYTYSVNNVFKGDGKSRNHVITITWSDVW